jgi:hypothetical protein
MTDRLNELSRNTLQSYLKKAGKDYKKLGTKADHAKTADDAFKISGQQMKRAAGITGAQMRLKGERYKSPRGTAKYNAESFGGPTNSIGTSSTVHGTGPIDTIDKPLGKKLKGFKVVTRRT